MKRFGKKKNSRKGTSIYHPGDTPSDLDRNGRVMDLSEQRAMRKRAGLCEECGIIETHKVHLRGTVRVPQTVQHKSYKGKCLNCMSMTQARLELNEATDSFDIRGTQDRRPVQGDSGAQEQGHRMSIYSTGSGQPSPGRAKSNPPSVPGGSHAGYPRRRSRGASPARGYQAHAAAPSNGGSVYRQGGAYPVQAQHGGYPGEEQHGSYPHQAQVAAGGYPAQGQHGGPHFTQQQMAECAPRSQIPGAGAGQQVPHYIAPYVGPGGGVHDDDNMTVVSELTLDPGLLVSAAANSNDDEGLGKIEEESDGNDVGSSYSASHRRNASGGRSHVSNGSGNRRGAVPSRGDDRIMNRKLRENDLTNATRLRNSGSGASFSDAAFSSASTPQAAARGAQHSSRMGNLLEDRIQAKMRADAASHRSDSGSHHESGSLHGGGSRPGAFKDDEGTQPKGGMLQDRIQAKMRTDAASHRSDSGSQHDGETRFDRSRSGGDAASMGSSMSAWEEKMKRKNSGHDDSLKKMMSRQTADEQFNRRFLEKANTGGEVSVDRRSRGDSASQNADVAPGVQRMNDDGAYRTLMDKKIARSDRKGDDEHVTMPLSEVRNMILNCSSCSDAVEVLKHNTSLTPTMVLMALEKLRELVLNDFFLSQDSRVVPTKAFRSNGWAKIMTMVLSHHSSSPIVTFELLQTLWSIVSILPRYTTVLLNADVKQIASAMETNPDEERVQEYGCGLLSSVAASDRHARNLLDACDGRFVKTLMTALRFRDGAGRVQGNALKALFRLSSASLSSGTTTESFAKRMGSHVEGADGKNSVSAINAVIEAMGNYPKNLSVQILGNRLLWNVFTPNVIDDQDFVEILTKKILKHMKLVASLQHSQGLNELVGCLLSKMSSFMTSDLHSDFLCIAVDTMRTYSNSAIVALHACRCLFNVFARSSASSLPHLLAESLADGLDAIQEITSCMKIFREHGSIQSEACAALAAACINSTLSKKKIHELGGIDLIKKAYDLFCSNRNEGPCVETKIRACTALTSLAINPIAMSEIQDKGIVTEFRCLLEESELPLNLQSAMQDLVNLALGADGSGSLTFKDSSSEEETCHCIRANLRVITSSDFTPNKIPALRSGVLRAMRRFRSSSGIHQDGCKLLACVFAMSLENESIPSEEILSEVLLTIVQSLSEHKNIAATAAAVCSALQNFCIMLSQSDACSVLELSDLLSQSLNEVVNTIVIYHQDEQIMVQASGALQAVCAMKEGLSLTFETDTTIQLIIGAMTAFPESVKLQRHGIGVLGLFAFVSSKILNFVTDQFVTLVIRFIEKECDNPSAADLIDTSINILLVITKKGYEGVMALLRNEEVVCSVARCMYQYPTSPSVQAAGIDILTNISLDNYIRADVCQRAGTTRIISALKNLKSDPQVAIKAFSALANLINGADAEILRAPDTPAPSVMVGAMTANPKNLTVQIQGAYALWALSAKNDSFKHEIVNFGGAKAVAQAMTEFPASRMMQSRGFVVMWSLAVPAPLKVTVGAQAVTPVVNGLCAHVSSAKNCEDSLGCLRSLSTISANKRLLEDAGAVDIIYSCLWLHSECPLVCKAALAALCNVSVNVERNEVSEFRAEDLEPIIVAMRNHQNVKGVQESAIILLRNFTLAQTNVAVLVQNPFLGELVRSAMSIHQDNFKGRADALLRVLPQVNQ